MKIAHLTTVDSSLVYLLLPQLQAAKERGWEVLGISAAGSSVPLLEQAGIRHVALSSSTRSMNLVADLRAARQLWTTLKREHVQVLHTHNPKPGVYGRIVGRLAGVPMIVNTHHGLYATEDDHWLKRSVVYALEAVASRFSHAELVQNPEDLEVLLRYRISPRRKTSLLGNGVDLERFDPSRVSDADRRSVRRELGVAEDSVLVGTVGRLVGEKGYRELFTAISGLGERYVLVVVGPEDPDKPDALPGPVIEAARVAGVRFLGFRPDVERLYAAMDLFVLASHREGFPRAAMEAAAMGILVVATDIRGCRQVVEAGVTGLLVPVRDPASLRAAILRLGEDVALRSAMGAASARRARQEFDEREVVRKVMDAYDRSRPSPPSRRMRLRWHVKRVFDLVVSAAALVALAPVFAIVALAIRVVLGRPVLFVQWRPGLGGEPFRIYKFRTMRDERDADGTPLPDEARLTRLGRFLRSTSLDELPELVNVLRGEMSLVGPRPLLLEYVPLYSPRQARRLWVRPGITGWAQINGRNTQPWDERLELDVWYVENWSMGLDARILSRTLGKVLRREGISMEGHATMPFFEGSSRDGEGSSVHRTGGPSQSSMDAERPS